MEEKALAEIREELRAIRDLIQPTPREFTEEERQRALQTLARVRRGAKKRRVSHDSTDIIREERDS